MIIDDEEDIRDILEMSLEAYSRFEIIHAISGNDAIAKIQGQSFDCIICDYNMPDGNGGDVYQYLLNNNIKTKYVLCSSDRPDQHECFSNNLFLYFNIEKPYLLKGIEHLFQKLISETDIDIEITSLYCSVPIRLLYKIIVMPVDIYIKISDAKYVKILNKDDLLDELDFIKYQHKGIRTLYIESGQLQLVCSTFEALILNRFSAQRKKGLCCNDFGDGISLLNSYVLDYGFNANFSTAITDASTTILNTILKSNNLSLLLDKLLRNGDSYIAKHSILLSIITPLMAKKLKWSNRIMDEKLVIASLFHDITLNTEFAETLNNEILRNDKNFQTHCFDASDIIKNIEEVPPDTHVIILEHHEVDTPGISRGIPLNRVSPLGLLLGFCHLFVDQLFSEGSVCVAIDNIKDKVDLCSQYRLFYQALKDLDI